MAIQSIGIPLKAACGQVIGLGSMTGREWSCGVKGGRSGSSHSAREM